MGCFHDFLELKRISEAQLEANIRFEIKHPPDIEGKISGHSPPDVSDYGSTVYKKKVCRKCELVVDGITKKYENLKPSIQKDMELEEKYK